MVQLVILQNGYRKLPGPILLTLFLTAARSTNLLSLFSFESS